MHTPISGDMPPVKCEFCGSKLEPRYLEHELCGKLHRMFCGYEECTCPGSARQRESEAREARATRERDRAIERLEAYQNAGIPPKYIGARADLSSGLPKVLAGRGLYIQGGNGTGKTTYASALAMSAIDLGRSVVFTSSSRMKGELFSTSKSCTEEDLFRKWSAPYLLVIDDLGKECANRAVVPMLYRVINERDEQMRPVVVTSNFGKKELGEKLAECGDESCAMAIVSRLFGMTDKMEFEGADRRLS